MVTWYRSLRWTCELTFNGWVGDRSIEITQHLDVTDVLQETRYLKRDNSASSGIHHHSQWCEEDQNFKPNSRLRPRTEETTIDKTDASTLSVFVRARHLQTEYSRVLQRLDSGFWVARDDHYVAIMKVHFQNQNYKFGAELNLRPPGAVSPTGRQSGGWNSAPGNVTWPERNRSLHSTRHGDFGWVNMRQLNSMISGPKFTKLSAPTWRWLWLITCFFDFRYFDPLRRY